MEKGYCRECGKNKRAVKVGQVSHWLHAFLSVLTVGFWVLPWLYIAATSKPKYVCKKCGDELKPITRDGKQTIEDDTPFLVKLRGWVVFIVFVTIATVIADQFEGRLGFGQYLLVLYVILAIYFTLLATIKGRSKGNGEGLEAFVQYTLNNSIFIAFALVTRSLFVTFLGDAGLEQLEVSGLGAFQWASIGVPIVGFAISSFTVFALATQDLFEYETHKFYKKKLVVAIPALIGLFGTVYFFFSFDLIGLQYAWWQFGLISLIPTAITLAASLSEA